MDRQEEQNRNEESKKTNRPASSKLSDGKDWKKRPDYEGEQNWQRNAEEVWNWRKNGPILNSGSSQWRRNTGPINDSSRKSGWRHSSKEYSSAGTSSPRIFHDKKNLVFDKRDFLFPDVPKKIREQIQLDEVAKYSVTDMRTADEISNFITKLDGLNGTSIVITDGTACAGGNAISFCKNFKTVQAVELDRNRYDMLMHNLKILGCTNATCYQANYLELVCRLTQDIVFLDPPWGGPSYKEKDQVELFIGDVPLSEVCENLKSRTKYVVIKAPTNLNYAAFKANVTGNLQVLHRFRKMLLIVVDYYHHPGLVQQSQATNNYSKIHDKTHENGIESINKGKVGGDKDELIRASLEYDGCRKRI